MKFDFSKSSDLQNKFQLNKLDLINQNILYLTHEVDRCVKLLKDIQTDKNLQKQVDDYFSEDEKEPPQTGDLD